MMMDDKDRSGSGRGEIARKLERKTRSWPTLTQMGRILNGMTMDRVLT